MFCRFNSFLSTNSDLYHDIQLFNFVIIGAILIGLFYCKFQRK